MSEQKKILIIEDEKLIAGSYAAKFSMSGFQALTAANGQEGYDTALREHPDCILLDLNMPVLDGWGFLKKLRKDRWGDKALVILLTNMSDVQLVTDRLKYGVFDYLVKANYTPAEIVEQVRHKLSLDAAPTT